MVEEEAGFPIIYLAVLIVREIISYLWEKTFKGLSNEEFNEITKILLTKKIEEKEWGIVVKPEIVVEVFFSEIEKSPFYESGYALRFA